jgi:hypothetical protein
MDIGGPEYVRRSAPFFFWENSRRNSQLPGMYCHKTMGSLVVKMRPYHPLHVKCDSCTDKGVDCFGCLANRLCNHPSEVCIQEAQGGQ